MQKVKECLVSLMLLVSVLLPSVFAQNEISSPYSRYGVGIINNNVPGTLHAMGGVSYAMQSNLYINFTNPASYVAFDSLSFIADVAFNIVSSTLRTNELSQRGTYARASYITIGLPVTRRWRTSVGFLPFSDRGYDIVDAKEYDEIGNVRYEYLGDGGMMQLYWGNAFKICKGLSIGLNASYIFGRFTSERYVEFDEDYYYNYRIAQTDLSDGIYLQAGLQYFANINENHRLGLGVVYENSAYIWSKRSELVNHYVGEYNEVIVYDTTSLVPSDKGKMKIPQSAGGGLSYCYKDKILVGADFTWQNWSKYSNMGRGDSLKDACIAKIGLQYIPDPTSGKFGKNIAYRIGAKFSTGYIKLRNTPVDEWAVTVGIGLPLRSYTTKCSMNIMFEYGGMGTLNHNLIRQNYFKFGFNFILQERWYQRVKLE